MSRDWRAGKAKCRDEWRCRLCGGLNPEPHHIVPRSVGGSDDPANIVPLDRPCHNAVHAKSIDLLPHLNSREQANAVLLAGSIEGARMLLAPSAYKNGRAAV